MTDRLAIVTLCDYNITLQVFSSSVLAGLFEFAAAGDRRYPFGGSWSVWWPHDVSHWYGIDVISRNKYDLVAVLSSVFHRHNDGVADFQYASLLNGPMMSGK